MKQTLIPAELLAKSDRILFIAHLALGDFTYLQNCFQAFSKAYPHLRVHLWVDEVRRTADASKWESLKKYSLYDWVEACPFFDKVYKRTYSPELLKESILEAKSEHYPIVVSLATLRPHLYANIARQISPDGFVVGMKKPLGILQSLFQPQHRSAYAKLDAGIPPYAVDPSNPLHISDVYAEWFHQLCGLEISVTERFPFVKIPLQWTQYAEKKLLQWGANERSRKIVFLNPFAKTKKRCWPLARIAELIAAMRKEEVWRDALFIVNAVPSELRNVRDMIAVHKLVNTEAFSAEENFFQLPAILAQCDLIISVETAVMHLANAVQVPVIALMRQKNPEWVPIDRNNSTVITAARRSDWVEAITVEQVMKELQ